MSAGWTEEKTQCFKFYQRQRRRWPYRREHDQRRARTWNVFRRFGEKRRDKLLPPIIVAFSVREHLIYLCRLLTKIITCARYANHVRSAFVSLRPTLKSNSPMWNYIAINVRRYQPNVWLSACCYISNSASFTDYKSISNYPIKFRHELWAVNGFIYLYSVLIHLLNPISSFHYIGL